MTTWADIQRLAADLQRVQLSQSAKKLSDSNCIEVISKLIEKKLIEVVFTKDGHAYVTRKHLCTEVKNECLANRGRAALTDISTALNIDFDHVDRAVREIIQADPEYVLSKGELFAREYVDNLLSDLRSLLKETGAQTLHSLCKKWDISMELLQSLVLNNLPTDFDGILDGDTIYTNEYLVHHTSILRAVLAAITKPTPISNILNRVLLPHKRFWAAYDELVDAGEITGKLTGSRSSPSCTYVPVLHNKLVDLYVQNTYRQNEYIQKSLLKKVGVQDSKAAVVSLVNDKKLESFPTIFISASLHEQAVNAVKELIGTQKFVEVQSVLQNLGIPFEIEDVDELCERLIKGEKELLTAEGYIYTSHLLRDTLNNLEEKIEKTAHSELDRIESDKKQQSKQQTSNKKGGDDDDDWGDNKGKGKKKGGKGNNPKSGRGKTTDDDDRSSSNTSITISKESVVEWINSLSGLPECLTETIAEGLIEQVEDRLRNRVKDLILTQKSADAQSQKKNIQALQVKARSIYDSVCAFEASSNAFPDPLGTDLSNHIIRTVGNELAAVVLSYASGTENAGALTEKQRDETIASLPTGSREAVAELYDSLKKLNYDSLHDAMESVSSRSGCALMLRPADSKAIASWTESYIRELQESVTTQTDPAAILLTVVLLLLAKAGKPTTASGKFVARLVSELSGLVPETTHELLMSSQKGVVTCIKNKDDEIAKDLLNKDIEKLKAIVLV